MLNKCLINLYKLFEFLTFLYIFVFKYKNYKNGLVVFV